MQMHAGSGSALDDFTVHNVLVLGCRATLKVALCNYPDQQSKDCSRIDPVIGDATDMKYKSFYPKFQRSVLNW